MSITRVATLVTCLALVGCTVQPRPPAFNLYGRQKLVVLPFENTTTDPALAATVQDDILAGLLQLNAVPVVDQSQVAAIVQRMGGAGSAETDPAFRLKIADAFKCDLIMVGAVTAYGEDTRRDEPRRIPITFKQGQFKWGYSDVVTARVEATVKVIDAANGTLLWIRKADQQGQVSRWVDLPWPGDNPNPPERGGWHGGDREDRPREHAAAAAPAGQPAAGTAAPANGQQPVTIIINNNQSVTQNVSQTNQQTATQAQAQAQGTTGVPAAPAAPRYGQDANLFRARANAVQQVGYVVLADFHGVGGWSPANAATPASTAPAPLPATAPAPR